MSTLRVVQGCDYNNLTLTFNKIKFRVLIVLTIWRSRMKQLFILSLSVKIALSGTLCHSQNNEQMICSDLICPFDEGKEIPENFSPTFFKDQPAIKSGDSFVNAVLVNSLGPNGRCPPNKEDRLQFLVKMLEKAQLTVTNSLDGMSYFVKMIHPYNSLKNLCFIKAPPSDSKKANTHPVRWNSAPSSR